MQKNTDGQKKKSSKLLKKKKINKLFQRTVVECNLTCILGSKFNSGEIGRRADLDNGSKRAQVISGFES